MMSYRVISRYKFYVTGARLPFITASILPALIAIIWGLTRGAPFYSTHAFLAISALLALHVGANTTNDFFDWDRSDKINRYTTPFSGGSRARVENILSKKVFLYMAIASFTLACALGIWLTLMDRPLVLMLGISGGLLAILYSATPLELQSRGLGETAIFLAFGPLITLGIGYASFGFLSPEFFYIGVPNGLAVANILLANEFPDFEADQKSGKRNLVVRLGTSKARYAYIMLFVLFYLSVAALSYTKIYPLSSLVILLSLPLAAKAALKLWKNHASPNQTVSAQRATIQFQVLTAILILISLVIP